MAFTYTGEKVDLGFGRGWLNRPAANSIRRIDAQIGHPLQITEAGRTWLQQNEHYQHYLRYGSPIALSPNAPSLHQKGNAADSNEAQRIHAIMEDHGWRRTVYRWVNGKWTLVEPWHYEYFPELDNHRHEGTPAGAGEADMTPQESQRLDAVYAAVFGPKNLNVTEMTWANPDGQRKALYGLLDISIYTQQLVIAQAGQIAALTAAVQQLGTGGGTIDMERIAEAAERGARESIESLVLVPKALE